MVLTEVKQKSLAHFKSVSALLIVGLPKISHGVFDFRARFRLIEKVTILYEICKDTVLQDSIKP